MTNRPPEQPERDNALTAPTPDPVLETKIAPDKQPHDLQAEDLKLVPETPARRYRRHHVSPTESTLPEGVSPVLLTPQPSKHHHRHHRKKKKHTVRRVLLIALSCVLAIAVIAGGTVMFLNERGRQALLAAQSAQLTAPEEVLQTPDVTISDDGHAVTYNGKQYVFNENRTNILFIGMDKDDLGLDDEVVGTGGQADTIVVLSVDTATGQVDALAVSRDIMVDVELYAEDGSFVGVENTQICLSYAYGDGRETSCDNVVRAASRLLYGIPINSYLTVDLSAIAVLNDAVGGVELRLLRDLRRNDNSWAYAGDVITLHGQEAHRYIRARDVEYLDSNNARMERQKQYMRAFFEKALAATKQDLSMPLTLYNTVASDCITNLSPAKITYLGTTLVQHSASLTFHQVPGHVVEGDNGYAEYVPDQKALYEQVLEIFYTQVG